LAYFEQHPIETERPTQAVEPATAAVVETVPAADPETPEQSVARLAKEAGVEPGTPEYEAIEAGVAALQPAADPICDGKAAAASDVVTEPAAEGEPTGADAGEPTDEPKPKKRGKKK
jgi:hypothetical protein